MAELSRGANVPLSGTRLELAVSGAREGAVDLMVFQLAADRKVRDDADFVFFNQPVSPEGGVRLTGADRVGVDLGLVPRQIEVLAVAVALDDSVGGSLADITGLGVVLSGSDPHAAPAAGLTSERAAVLIEIYRRAGGWKLRNVSAGWTAGLPALAREHGVVVDQPSPQPAVPPVAVPPVAVPPVAVPPAAVPPAVVPPAVVPPAVVPLPAAVNPAAAQLPTPSPGGWAPPGGSLPPPVFVGPVPRPGGWAPPGKPLTDARSVVVRCVHPPGPVGYRWA